MHADLRTFTGRVEVPTAVAIFRQDIGACPAGIAERWFDVARWIKMPRGGHFAAWEEPQLLAQDLRTFFGTLAA